MTAWTIDRVDVMPAGTLIHESADPCRCSWSPLPHVHDCDGRGTPRVYPEGERPSRTRLVRGGEYG